MHTTSTMLKLLLKKSETLTEATAAGDWLASNWIGGNTRVCVFRELLLLGVDTDVSIQQHKMMLFTVYA